MTHCRCCTHTDIEAQPGIAVIVASGSRVSRFVVLPTDTVGENSLSLTINWSQLQLGSLRSVDTNKQRHVVHVLPKPMYLGMKFDVILIVIQLTV